MAESVKVRLLINVLKGATASKDDLKKMVDKANDILKQADVQLDFDPNRDIKTEVSDEGNDDGIVNPGENRDLHKAGQKELDVKAGKGKGYKVYIAKGF